MRKSDYPEIPAALADVALIDDTTCAAAAGMSITYWRDLVAQGVAPQPAIQGPRFTRWRIADVRGFLIEFVSNADPAAAELSASTAAKGLAGARAKRASAATAPASNA